jgi:type II secretory pathway pseudopilin PulG
MMNKNGFTLIHMAALLLILGIALVVTARHFSSSNVTAKINRYAKEADEADKELKFFLSKYRYMPNHTDTDIYGAKPPFSRFMANDASTVPELLQRFTPRANMQIMYIAPVIDTGWTGDICATFPHIAPYDNITSPNNDYSVRVVYCDDNITVAGSCATPRYTMEQMIYAIVHPGDDGAFTSSISGNTLYVPTKGNDDLVRYYSAREAFDLGNCSLRVGRIPRQDLRYHNYNRAGQPLNTLGNEFPPSIRSYVTVDEHLVGGQYISPGGALVAPGNGTSCTVRSGNFAIWPSIIATVGDSVNYANFTNGYTLPLHYVQSCTKVHLEYPVNRLGETYASEKCCIELTRTSPALPAAGFFESNCQLKFNEVCSTGDGTELRGATPYIDIIGNPLVVGFLNVPVSGRDTLSTPTNHTPIPARLKITFRNGNRLYRIDNDATIRKVEW